jgi:hypothetical protein
VGLPVVGEASRFTNPINYLPFKTPIDFRLPKKVLGTKRLFGFLGRANLVLGVGLLAYDATSIAVCAAGD